ncbi:MAG: hypothetical protein JWN57_424 [Frankiales bacterium]|jgi:hypothetical protein|nr:hypothetical protein [Frankiales bacterium]
MRAAPRDPGVPDVAALRRRVLLTAVVAMTLFVAAAYTVMTLGVSDFWLLVLAVLIWVLVVRPLMRPVREVVGLRRRLAYQAFLEQRREEQR